MVASVTISSSALSPTTKTILCNTVTAGVKRDVIASPNANPTNLAYVQTQGVENPAYTVQGVLFTGASGTLTYADMLTLIKLNYSGSNAPVLTVTYGIGSSTQVLANFAGSTTGISVILKDFNFPISVTDSRGGYMPVATLNFVETR